MEVSKICGEYVESNLRISGEYLEVTGEYLESVWRFGKYLESIWKYPEKYLNTI